MSRRGVYKSGVFKACGEPPRMLPQCMGRLHREQCNCQRWTPEERVEAVRLKLTADTSEELERMVQIVRVRRCS